MKKLARLGAASATVATISLLGLSSVASAASIHNTGPFSRNSIYVRHSFNYHRTNTNTITVTNNNQQTATSGRAVVFFNTFGGNAISGSATNWSSTSTTIRINN